MKRRLVIEVEAGDVGCGNCRLLIRGPTYQAGPAALRCAMGWQEYTGPKAYEENVRRGPMCLDAESFARDLLVS